MRQDHPVSERFFSHEKLASAIIRLCARVVGHSCLVGDSQIVGISIRVGTRIFNIVRGLSFVGGRYHGCELLLPGGLGLH